MAKQKTSTKYKMFQFPIESSMSLVPAKYLKRINAEAEFYASLSQMREQNQLNHMTVILTVAGQYFAHHNRKALFLTEDNLNFFRKGRYSIKSFDADMLPFPIFTINFPKDFRLGGVACRGLAAWFQDDIKEFRQCSKKVLKRIGLDENEDDFAFSALAPESYRKLMISIQGVDGAHYLNHLTADVLDLAINHPTPKQFNAYFEQDEFKDVVESAGCIPLDESENNMFYEAARLVMGLSIYCQYNPDALSPGLPGGAQLLRTPYELLPATTKIATPTKHGYSKREHHRTWFLRQLWHEKYYQGEFKDTPRGHRWVFVDETLVNSEKDPQHVSS